VTDAVPAPDIRKAGFVMELRRKGFRDRRILSAMERVPREPFLAPDLAEVAYADRALPIACGQMIERPSQFAGVLEALALESDHRVLEIGTGSGWSTAVLASLAREVVTLDRFRTLTEQARTRVERLGIGNVVLRLGDALSALPDGPAFDRIYVSGAVTSVPTAILARLAEFGVLVAPVGPPAGVQALTRFAKGPLGTLETPLGAVRAVPLESGVALAT
jgi:protein-L-isoaspartate(D-aspartate) O-methyltransferase